MTAPSLRIVATDTRDTGLELELSAAMQEMAEHDYLLPMWQRIAIIGGGSLLCWILIGLAVHALFF